MIQPSTLSWLLIFLHLLPVLTAHPTVTNSFSSSSSSSRSSFYPGQLGFNAASRFVDAHRHRNFAKHGRKHGRRHRRRRQQNCFSHFGSNFDSPFGDQFDSMFGAGKQGRDTAKPPVINANMMVNHLQGNISNSNLNANVGGSNNTLGIGKYN